MNKIYLILLLFGFGLLASFKPAKETGITWYDWNEGYALAKKKDKMVLVDIFTSWCGWCKKMDRDTYSDADIANLMNKNFVAIKFNPEKTDVIYKIDTLSLNGYQLLNILTNGQRSGYPTTVMVNAKKNQVVHAEAGYMDANQFKKTVKTVLDAHK